MFNDLTLFSLTLMQMTNLKIFLLNKKIIFFRMWGPVRSHTLRTVLLTVGSLRCMYICVCACKDKYESNFRLAKSYITEIYKKNLVYTRKLKTSALHEQIYCQHFVWASGPHVLTDSFHPFVFLCSVLCYICLYMSVT